MSTAVSQFENDYTPPATGYAGIDVGWSAYTDPPNHQEWHVDRDATPDPVLVAVDVPLVLVFQGSRSVTEIGNDCDIPRNQAQKLVKALEKQDLVQMVDNPENKRTKLVELTDSGGELVGALERREIELLSSLPLAATPADLRSAATALAAVRQALGDEEWRKLLGNGAG